MSEPQQFTPDTVKKSGEEIINNDEQTTNQVLSVGAQLAHKRQQNGWSIDDVANQLKLAPRQIQAIEDNNYAALPTIVMTRGYIRSYAKMLGLDPAEILPSTIPVAAAQVQILGTESRSTFFSESRLLLGGRNRVTYKWILAGIVLAFVGIVVTQFSGLSALRQSPTELVVPLAASEASSEASSATAPDNMGSDAGSAVLPAPDVASTASLQPQNAVAGTPVVAAEANQLHLTFKQDSWVEIKRADKSTLFSKVGKAGSTETIEIDQPVSVVIGNLAGVQATLRGTAIDLKSDTKNNIARLNLK
ncbi:helix-turn-helix domain-containing protein [Glaciimonas sp. GG7]